MQSEHRPARRSTSRPFAAAFALAALSALGIVALGLSLANAGDMDAAGSGAASTGAARTGAASAGAASAGAADATVSPDPALQAVIGDATHRSAKFVARDVARHPAGTLAFFGLRADQNVIELWPGGGYWTEILGPYLRGHGHYAVGLPARSDEPDERSLENWKKLTAPMGDRLGTVRTAAFGAGRFDLGPPGSADLVLTFRNLHNWMGGGYADQALAGIYKVLKPGGILGIEEHRGRDDQPQDPKAENGYVRQDYTIELARRAGFELVGSSELNANPRDTKDWVDGVWTLPPTLTQGEKDREKYVAVGEADNFLLKFRKPR